jgi:hypothetical protein
MALIFARKSKQISIPVLTEKMHKYFARYGKTVADIIDCIEKIEGIYNYGLRASNLVDLVSEYKNAVRKEKINESEAKGK